MHHEYGVAAIDSASRHRPDHSPLGRLRRAYVGNREREIARERLSLAIPDNASGLFEIANYPGAFCRPEPFTSEAIFYGSISVLFAFLVAFFAFNFVAVPLIRVQISCLSNFPTLKTLGTTRL